MAEDKNEQSVSITSKVSWGLGGLANDMANALWILALPIFSVGLGVKATWMGIALALPRIWDAVSDPLMGHISDNTRSRWGRRRPYIFFGAIGMGVSFALLWIPNPEWTESTLLCWFICISLLYYTFFTMWNIPWVAMGYEMTPDVKERNVVQAWRSWFSTGAAFICPAIMPLAIKFGSGHEVAEVVGVRWVGLVVGIIIIVTAVPGALFTKDRPDIATPPKVNFLKSVKFTFKDRAFLSLCFYAALFCGGIILVAQMGYYLNVFYVYGDLPLAEAKEASGDIMFWGGITGAVANLVSVPIISKCASRFGKKPTLLWGVLIVAIGQGVKWSCFVPEYPWAQVWLSILIYPGIILTWTLVPSMIADICDLDELNNGTRREGMYGATFGWLLKLGCTLSVALSGWLINVVGVIDSAEQQTPEAIFGMRVLFAVLPTVLVMVAGVFILKYPISEADAEETKRKLTDLHHAKEAE